MYALTANFQCTRLDSDLEEHTPLRRISMDNSNTFTANLQGRFDSEFHTQAIWRIQI